MASSNGRQGKNSTQLRQYNEKLVLQALRRMGAASKADLARSADLTSAAVGSIVKRLLERNLIYHSGTRHDGQRGKPAEVMSLNPVGAYSIGVSIDRNCLQTVLSDFDGNLISRISHDMILPSPERALEIVLQDINEVKSLLPQGVEDRLAGIGLAQPYNLGSWLELLGLPGDTFRSWDEYDFATELEVATGISVYSENDKTAASIAEFLYGAGRQIDNFLYIFIGPAPGGGVVLGGSSLSGVTGNAGDVGVMPVPVGKLDSAPRPAGDWDILLNRASLNSLIRHLEFHNVPAGGRPEVEAAIASDHPAFLEWLEDCVEALTPVVWAGRTLLDVPVVIMGAEFNGGLVEKINSRLEVSLRKSAPESRNPPELISGAFGFDAGAIGAASLPVFYSFSPNTAGPR